MYISYNYLWGGVGGCSIAKFPCHFSLLLLCRFAIIFVSFTEFLKFMDNLWHIYNFKHIFNLNTWIFLMTWWKYLKQVNYMNVFSGFVDDIFHDIYLANSIFCDFCWQLPSWFPFWQYSRLLFCQRWFSRLPLAEILCAPCEWQECNWYISIDNWLLMLQKNCKIESNYALKWPQLPPVRFLKNLELLKWFFVILFMCLSLKLVWFVFIIMSKLYATSVSIILGQIAPSNVLKRVPCDRS